MIQLGLSANWKQFALLVMINAFVASFGATKAVANLTRSPPSYSFTGCFRGSPQWPRENAYRPNTCQ